MTKNARTAIIYGESGSGKTTSLFSIAQNYHKETNKRIRLINCSGGGQEPFEASGYLDEGIVQLCDIARLMQGSEHKLALMKRLAKGYWPIEVTNNSGNLVGGEVYFKEDNHCMTLDQDNIGMYLFEDLKSLGLFLLAHLSEKDQGTGFKHAWKVEEDGYEIGGLQEGHYGIVQNEIFKLIQNYFRILPIDWFISTSLVGSDGNNKKPPTLYGPAIAGNASTSVVPSWFGDCLYLKTQEVIYQDESGQQTLGFERRCYFKDYREPDSLIPYKAKIRAIPVVTAKLEAKWPDGYIVMEPETMLLPILKGREKLNEWYRKQQEIALAATGTLK